MFHIVPTPDWLKTGCVLVYLAAEVGLTILHFSTRGNRRGRSNLEVK